MVVGERSEHEARKAGDTDVISLPVDEELDDNASHAKVKGLDTKDFSYLVYIRLSNTGGHRDFFVVCSLCSLYTDKNFVFGVNIGPIVMFPPLR